jgi:hypothetical protein
MTVQRDETAAAEARAWLAENEDATAMTPERIAALEAAAARNDEAAGAVLESMLEPAGATVGAGETAAGGAEPVVLDEAISPVAGRRFNRA